VFTLVLAFSTSASAKNPVQYLKAKWGQQLQAMKARSGRNAKIRRVRNRRAKRQAFHRAQAKTFRKDFKAWARDPQIASIEKAQKSALDLPNLKMRYGIGSGLSLGTAGLAVTAMATGAGNPAGLVLATAYLMEITPDGSKLPSKAHAARLATLIQASSEGHRIPRSMLPVYNRDLRIARMKLNRQIRSLSQQLAGYEGAMKAVKPRMGNVRVLSAEQAGQIGVERALARMRAAAR
jgi:hypothetical protein